MPEKELNAEQILCSLDSKGDWVTASFVKSLLLENKKFREALEYIAHQTAWSHDSLNLKIKAREALEREE